MTIKGQLTLQEQQTVASAIATYAKNPRVAYWLWGLTGFMGGHRYYFGKTWSAVAMTLIFWIGVWYFGVGALITGVWWLYDGWHLASWLSADRQYQTQTAVREITLRKQLRAKTN
ncbi:TM2 domain-containing protein [Lactiplantibacillus fabifermentans]|uniref:TM2 domain-containing protein n=2 Tax=Lactiplantibacillus fabifermentans TaxID=483011 RepID=A0A0R2NQA3_9LACO|nr:TM2 domain-containing protein [Lactiplantibacillus fabifermentans]ETY74465.1 hypothetical protein LFAB_06605 [Lactiplantibacillus fabifermentans T30PCM01]KRO27894.1 hypothetical protein DY78_GL002797 [Lactiplantibacillus fabifermentans DSM 21115]